MLLGEISYFHAAADFNSAACLQFPHENLQERRFPRAVFPDERNAVPFANEERDVV